MVLLLGGGGYIGEAFVQTLRARGVAFFAPSRATLDYTRGEVLARYLAETRPEFVINAAGFTGRPNVDQCEVQRAETLLGNTLFPAALAQACAGLDIPFGHVSSGCIYNGAKISENGATRIESDLTRPEIRRLLGKNPGAIRGFTETDPPNFSFRQERCSFYSGTKALAEEAIDGVGKNYIWRLRIPFDHLDMSRNYLSKLCRYPKVYENLNSLSHRGEFAAACVELWRKRAPFGIYNVTNPGFVSTRQAVSLIERILKPARPFQFWSGDEEFYRVAAKTPRSNCILDVSKLQAAGVNMRPVEEALIDSLEHWKPASA